MYATIHYLLRILVADDNSKKMAPSHPRATSWAAFCAAGATWAAAASWGLLILRDLG